MLVSETGVAKLADFGCSKQLVGMCTASLEESLRAIRGSVPWMAPEVITQSGHGRSSDIWSVGATVIEMATGRPPWPEFSNNLAALFHVATSKTPPPAPPHLSPLCAQFLGRCLVIDPKARASAADLINGDLFLQASPKASSSRQGVKPMSPAAAAAAASMAASVLAGDGGDMLGRTLVPSSGATPGQPLSSLSHPSAASAASAAVTEAAAAEAAAAAVARDAKEGSDPEKLLHSNDLSESALVAYQTGLAESFDVLDDGLAGLGSPLSPLEASGQLSVASSLGGHD